MHAEGEELEWPQAGFSQLQQVDPCSHLLFLAHGLLLGGGGGVSQHRTFRVKADAKL
jgi:hypothetical protein